MAYDAQFGDSICVESWVITMHDFDYRRPSTVDEAQSMLSADPRAKVLAGGQSLIVELKHRRQAPSVLVDLARLQLDRIQIDSSKIMIGAMATHAAIAASRELKASAPGLVRLASLVGDMQVRNWGTIGGSIANNDPDACYPAAMLSLGATIVTNRRRIPADEFFKGPFKTAVAHDELITGIEFMRPERSNYEKVRNPASRYALVGVFIAQGPAGTRVGVTAARAEGAFRETEIEKALAKSFTVSALANISTPSDRLKDDIHATAKYRAHLIGVLAVRCVSAQPA